MDPSGRFLRSFGSQGTADGRFNYPWGITTDALGFIYVCDKENHRVQVEFTNFYLYQILSFICTLVNILMNELSLLLLVLTLFSCRTQDLYAFNVILRKKLNVRKCRISFIINLLFVKLHHSITLDTQSSYIKFTNYNKSQYY